MSAKISSKVAAFSITALLLVVGFATVMTIIDESTSYNVDNPIEYDEERVFGVVRVGNASNDVILCTYITDIALLPSENDGAFLVDVRQTTDVKVDNPDRLNINILQPERAVLFSGDSLRYVITTEHNLSAVYFRVFPSSGNYNILFTQESPGVWVLELSQIDRLKLKGEDITSLVRLVMVFAPSAFPSSNFVEFSYDVYGGDIPVYYASTLAFVFGLILIVTALFATPFLSKDKIRVFYVNGRQNRQNRREARRERKRKIRELR